ncbi:MAG: hypothetical protein DRR19_24840 [Candidatus Parabeggiatoa sp. nov. 1]|nr:MAG: hypothetical protein DRR19_24840 [Gammaproteobacteria bacterium]
MKKSIFKENKKYTFSDYFDMNHPTEEIVGEFGYSYSLGIIELPESTTCNTDSIKSLKNSYYTVLPKETAKRQFLIAPLLFEIAKETESKISVEYPLEVDNKLSGYLDYLIRSKQQLVVIEAKKGDLDKGFNQLAAELIALDKYEEEGSLMLYGAITIGEMWRFSTLDRKSKHLLKDIHSHRIPEDVEKLFRILMGITELST